MLLRLLGAAGVLAAGLGLGNLAAARYQARTRELTALRTALELFATQIAYTATPLPDALRRTGRFVGGGAGRLLDRAVAILEGEEGVSAGEAWELALTREELPLTARDREVLRDLGPLLGEAGCQDQLRQLTLATQRLSAQEAESREEERRHVRLWRYLGFLGGAMLALALL